MTLVFVEGLPGTGKSHLASWLAKQLAEQGKRSELILETDSENPFRYKSGTAEDSVVEDVLRSVRQQWKDFAGHCSGDSIVVQESMTFQQQVNFCVFMNSCRCAENTGCAKKYCPSKAPLLREPAH